MLVCTDLMTSSSPCSLYVQLIMTCHDMESELLDCHDHDSSIQQVCCSFSQLTAYFHTEPTPHICFTIPAMCTAVCEPACMWNTLVPHHIVSIILPDQKLFAASRTRVSAVRHLEQQAPLLANEHGKQSTTVLQGCGQLQPAQLSLVARSALALDS